MKSISLSKPVVPDREPITAGETGREVPPGRTIIVALTGREFSLDTSCRLQWSVPFCLSSLVLRQVEMGLCLYRAARISEVSWLSPDDTLREFISLKPRGSRSHTIFAPRILDFAGMIQSSRVKLILEECAVEVCLLFVVLFRRRDYSNAIK